jgi:hypothetical protein
MNMSRDIRRSFGGKGKLVAPADQVAVDVDCKIELAGLLIDDPTPDGRNRRPEWRTVKGTLVLGAQAPGPLDPAVDYLLVLDGQVECRVRARRRQKSHTYDVAGAVTKPPV